MPTTATAHGQNSEAGTRNPYLDWVDYLKMVGLFLIIVNHIAEDAFGNPLIANPDAEWGTFSQRLAQLSPLPVSSWVDLFANAIRYVGYLGESGVGLFLIASGFGLAQSNLVKEPTDFMTFMRKRLVRLLPMLWMAHLLILFPPAFLGWKVSIAHPEFYMSLFGMRITPSSIYYGLPSWWFITLILQLYAVFPVFFAWIRQRPTVNLVVLLVVATLVRGVGLFWFAANNAEYLNIWSRGAFCVSRFAEFGFGIWLAIAMHGNQLALTQRLRNWNSMALAITAFAASTWASLTLSGMAFAPTTLGISLFVVVFSTVPFMNRLGLAVVARYVGKHSLSMYLVHHAVVRRAIDFVEAPCSTGFAVRVAAVFILTVVSAMILEWATSLVLKLIPAAIDRWGRPRCVRAIGSSLAVLLVATTLLEIQVRKYDPQEVPDFGWAERPSLAPHPHLGFTLRPNSSTRLRWESYDYTVDANSYGFPGPEFQTEKHDSVFRVLTIGDAFCSAEGVDTHLAWPRLLEDRLKRDRTAEVINLSATGYGPNQYAWLVQEYAPKLKPDVIILGCFTNEFDDVLLTAKEFEENIRFDTPAPDCWLGVVTGRHLIRYVRGSYLEPAMQLARGRVSRKIEFYSQIGAFERTSKDFMLNSKSLIRERFAEIYKSNKQLSCRIVVVAIPAPTQVARPEDIAWWPTAIDFDDTARFDMDQPQRLLKELADEYSFEFVDLRAPFVRERERLPYQRRNIHWTSAGHEIMAEEMRKLILKP